MSFRGYRRRVRIDPRPGCVSAWLEDDFHHFGVDLPHDGQTVLDLITHAPRYPWTTCPAAGAYLETRLRGVALAKVAEVEDQRQHCTHLYDLAMAAARHALHEKPVVYDISVAELETGGALAELRVDGAPSLRWRLGVEGKQDGVVGGDLGGDLAALNRWTGALPPEMAEAGLMFRRGVTISGGRRLDLEHYKTASEVGPTGVCYTFQPERAAVSARVLGAIRDFSEHPDDLLAEHG